MTVYLHESDVEGAGRAIPTPYNLTRVRSDTWNRLRDATRRLRTPGEPQDRVVALEGACRSAFDLLASLEPYHAFPGRRVLGYLQELFALRRYAEVAAACIRIVRMMHTGTYRRLDLETIRASDMVDLLRRTEGAIDKLPMAADRPYFEVLIVDDVDADEEDALRVQLRKQRRASDAFIYEPVLVRTFEDALLAVLANPSIEACLVRYSFPYTGGAHPELMARVHALLQTDRTKLAQLMPGDRTSALGELLKKLRPELDVLRVTSAPVETVATGAFRRVFYQGEDLHDLHLNLLKGVHDRHETPFFNALRTYSERPTGMFHALPVSRARSIAKSHWIKDYGEFYGQSLFMAETSTTAGGLDSLLQPTGTLKEAQALAARAFGADRTFFVTNGTSTANKIVTQALCRPGDIALLSHDCHKSHPYAMILGGVSPVYLDAYPLTKFSMYGGVSRHEIKSQLLALKRAGKLDRVRLLLLTNLTFDGITYDPYAIMQEALAIKPDLIFLWDEAWFAYGRFSPVLRSRTAMDATTRLERDLKRPEAEQRYARFRTEYGEKLEQGDASLADVDLVCDPKRARLRVYATHSTHKTLTALRQGSMIHVRDVDFERSASEAFHAAYMTHTSTSPNYQILASLDAGRRQVELEGYELVTGCLEMAFTLRERINQDPLLSRYFRALTPEEMVPGSYRPSGICRYFDEKRGLAPVETAWQKDEFVLDPTRVTLDVGRTGYDGNTFRNLLIDEYDIHINKTSRNTVLFLIHIGMTRGTIAQLVKTLSQIASQLDHQQSHASAAEREAFALQVDSLTNQLPPLPNFSRFHESFREPAPVGMPADGSPREPDTRDGDMRSAFFESYDEAACRFVPLDDELCKRVAAGEPFVSATFITPYPPGFPVLVPGQVVSLAILDYLRALDVKEIHGFEPTLGLRLFTEQALNNRLAARTPLAQPARSTRNPSDAVRAPQARIAE